MSEFKHELGSKATCKITGFKGTIIGVARYLTGCDQYCLKPKVDKDGKSREGEWFDEGQIKVTGKAIEKKEVKSASPGGPNDNNPSL